MYKAIFVALLLVLPAVLAQKAYENEIEKRASILDLVRKLLKDSRVHSLGCSATCALITAGHLSFLCPKACSVVLGIIGEKASISDDL